MKRKLLIGGFLVSALSLFANPVIVKMNTETTTMTLEDLQTGKEVALEEPTNREYSLQLEPGKYKLYGYANNGETLNGTIVINVTDSVTTQQFTVITCTAYVSNKTDNAAWVKDEDFTLDVKVNTREGVSQTITPGNSHKAANRYTFLALNGNSYYVAFIPTAKHQKEGYMTLYRGGTLTGNVNVTGAIPLGDEFTVTVPSDAKLQLGMKFTHFTDFTPVDPDSTEETGEGTTYHYTLANGQVYNYRTWKTGGLTHGGYFTMNTDAAKKPTINFTETDYAKNDPKAINLSAQSNNGYETGDILLNINPKHHLKLKKGEEFLVHGMRMWELTDNSTNNYFFEPDFHYTVLDSDFKPCGDIIEIENADTDTSAWSKITAKEKGTAIVTVTYDGINLNYYNNADKKEYLGGEYWGAIWPENTGVFVVTVDEEESAAVPNMTVNEKYNMDALRLAGNFVDAEHDVFYYLDSEEGFTYSFKPEGVASVEIAYPEITETEVRYKGFTPEGVTRNEDGTYSIFLKRGRNIVRLTDAGGHSVYQVMRAKPCHREITNETRPGSKIFQPGDQVKIQYSGLYHPANKIAGIYNMSAYITYNGVPNGSSLILGSGQYTFGSAASAQAVSVDIPADYDVKENPFWVMDEGVIQVNGYGDPIGNHRNTSHTAGRSPNFTAVPHKTYFGTLPDIKIELNPVRKFTISLDGVLPGAEVAVTYNDETLKADENGNYTGSYGTYSLVANAEGYKCFRKKYEIDDDSDDEVTFAVTMEELGDAWDGKTLKEPATDEDGVYQISNGAELAWFADNVNTNGGTNNAVLTKDIELGNFDWTPIGTTAAKAYTGTFKGDNHTISELYTERTANYTGLFGNVKDGNLEGLTVEGYVGGTQYVGGVAGYIAGTSTIDRCANYCEVAGSKTYVGGVTGSLGAATVTMTNCYNAGDVTGTTNCGGVAGYNNANTAISNIFNVGKVEGKTVAACVGGTTAKTKLTNAFAVAEYHIMTGQTTVTPEQMASGEVTYRLGKAFFQTIGEDSHPKFEGPEVLYDEAHDLYYNDGFSFEATELIMDTKELTLDLDHSPEVVLTAKYGPYYADEPEVRWYSEDESVATVEQDGTLKATVKAMKEGETTIRVEHVDNPDVYDTCKLYVTGETTSIGSIFDGERDNLFDIYDISGRIIMMNATQEDCRTLAPGIYVFRSGNKINKTVFKNK